MTVTQLPPAAADTSPLEPVDEPIMTQRRLGRSSDTMRRNRRSALRFFTGALAPPDDLTAVPR